MRLEDYRNKKEFTYQTLADFLGLDKTKVHRICTSKDYTVTLQDALIVKSKTNSAVRLEDLL